MTTTLALILLALALAIIAGLGTYAFSLCKEVKRRKAFREEERQRAHHNCLENLEIVAAALAQDQVDITEGSWRCKVLLEILDEKLTERPAFQAFDEVHRRTRHLHTHTARQALDPRDRAREDRERLTVEEEFREPVLKAAAAVVEFRRGWPENLH
ncbi:MULTISPECIES: DUF2489 domain-containing protein [Halomonas]|uniref:Uncharacterized protein DUF2489 n=1 Tax=Halomonas ventosae TaxID=229007 RepID=A0A4R6HXQ8_9GAMM|nr:DUF2489 domain-containing protein [Halomonas ventosae]TDO13922.1 uncharacterized protein DUF2489 [Halomonas ventosae]